LGGCVTTRERIDDRESDTLMGMFFRVEEHRSSRLSARNVDVAGTAPRVRVCLFASGTTESVSQIHPAIAESFWVDLYGLDMCIFTIKQRPVYRLDVALWK
jgi:hypothetical protein